MPRLERLIGVYDADGTVRGELAYALGHVLGTRSCALCDITHGRIRRRTDFDAAIATLAVPVELLHRDEQDDDLRARTDGALPCVLAATDTGLVPLLGRDELAALEGDPQRFVTAIRDRLAELDLAAPA
jgi:hypothetical protein